jgi:hypothetical protein
VHDSDAQSPQWPSASTSHMLLPGGNPQFPAFPQTFGLWQSAKAQHCPFDAQLAPRMHSAVDLHFSPKPFGLSHLLPPKQIKAPTHPLELPSVQLSHRALLQVRPLQLWVPPTLQPPLPSHFPWGITPPFPHLESEQVALLPYLAQAPLPSHAPVVPQLLSEVCAQALSLVPDLVGRHVPSALPVLEPRQD